MSIFFYNDIISKYEKESNYYPIIEYLESMSKKTKDDTILATLIGASWYYFMEGDVNQAPINYDWQKFLIKWKQYVDLSLEKYTDNEKICFVLGYTLDLHGFCIDESYCKKGKELMKRCFEITTTNEIKILVERFLLNPKKQKALNQSKINDACKKLFPTDSILDSYFKKIYMK